MKAANDKLSLALRAVADPTRRKILRLLKVKASARSENNGWTASDIESRVKLAQPTISHHMKILKKAGLIDTAKSGTWVYYKRNDQALRVLRSSLQDEV